MKKEQIEEMESALLDFVKRASQKRATPEEIMALPEVAKIICAMNFIG